MAPQVLMPFEHDQSTAHFSDQSWDRTRNDMIEDPDPAIGRQLSHYRLDVLLGRGATGRVYLAKHLGLGRACALKVLHEDMPLVPDALTRFQDEGRAASSLIHPNIVTTHAIGECSGRHFLEMEFLGGGSLAALVRDRGRLDPIRATQLLARVADGLSLAHRRGILHRDLKLANIMLTADGTPKVGDFGLARAVTPTKCAPAVVAVGTPPYMAPELFQRAEPLPASDIYALGVCYYVMLSGRLPYTGPDLATLISNVTSESHPPLRNLHPEIPLEIVECVDLMLAKHPGGRPQSGVAASQLLHAVLGQVRDLESLLREAFRDSDDVAWRAIPDGYEVSVGLPGGRRHRVILDPSEHNPGERLLQIYALCGPAQQSFYETALRMNGSLAFGGISVRNVHGRDYFVISTSYPRGTVDPEEIRRTVLEAAEQADRIEYLLTGTDWH